MKYFAIGIATVMICGAAGLSSSSGNADIDADDPVVVEDLEIIQEDVEIVLPENNNVPVEYIDFDPYYITAKVGKNEG